MIDVAEHRQAAIRALDLTKIYGDRIVVDHLNFSIYAGELYTLLGDNGAGKTTTLNMLTTLLKPTEGRFFICGNDGIADSEKTKGVFGVVSQDVSIYQELSAFENLRFIADLYRIPRKQASERIELLLEQGGLTERAHDIAGSFSGGMQRKLSIAIALLHKPKVIFMDEPTVGLDPQSRRQIWTQLKQLRSEGVAILLTTHYLEEAELLSDRIGIIRRGKLVAEGTIDELRYKIQGMRSVAVRITRDITEEELTIKLEKLKSKFSVEVRIDTLRHTVSFTPPKDRQLVYTLNQLLSWLEQENIPFSRFATNEPNLEEVFLAVASKIDDLDQARLAEHDLDED